MQLEDIGFYTLSDHRAKNVSCTSPLWRCELILTDKCNFRCPYCRGVVEKYRGDLSFEEAKHIVSQWADQGLKNIRFSGGEPTIWESLVDLCQYAKDLGIEKVAISTNGSASQGLYKKLLPVVNDFSISLDACCAEVGDTMSGGIKGSWHRVVENIRYIAQYIYTTVGVVLTPTNMPQFYDIVHFAHDLGVADIRIVTSAQWNEPLDIQLSKDILNAHPILKYRINNFNIGRNIRGIRNTDHNRCLLALDDMAVLKGKHYPCIIYMREHGSPIGDMIEDFRAQRAVWASTHDVHTDPICRKNCLDVCVDYNNRYKEFKTMR